MGDKLVAIAAIQSVASAGFAVAAFRNRLDEEMFSAAGIPQAVPDDRAMCIPWTDHVMAIPPGMVPEEIAVADSTAAHPVERALWGIGLDRFARPTPGLRLSHNGKKKAATVAWSPIETSRAPYRITAEEWKPILTGFAAQAEAVELVCALRDQPEAFALVSEMDAAIAKKTAIVSCSSFASLVERIGSAAAILAANSGPMWIALGTGSPCTVVQREATFPHMAMWQARDGWMEGFMAVELPDTAVIAV